MGRTYRIIKQDFHVKENLPRHFAFLKNMMTNGLTGYYGYWYCLEYGMKEGCLIEDMPADPANPYAIAKDESEKVY